MSDLDILDRLRARTQPMTHWETCADYHDTCAAIEEIERLRKDRERVDYLCMDMSFRERRGRVVRVEWSAEVDLGNVDSESCQAAVLQSGRDAIDAAMQEESK